MADDLTIEVTGSAEKAASALDKIIQKITDLQERFDKAAPSASKFAAEMEQIASSSKAFQAFQKMAGGLDKQAVSTKNAESKMAMYQARLDRANVSMERSRVQSEKLATALGKVSEAQKIAEANSAAFSMSPADFAAKYNHSSNGGADLTPQTSEGTEAGPAPVNVPVEKFDVSKIQANIDSMKPKISIDADSAMAELQRMGEYIDGLRPRISGMSEEAQAQFNALAAKLELVSRQIDNQRNAYRGLQSAALKAEQEQGNGSDAYLKLEKRILSADAASQRLAATQEKLKAELASVASGASAAGEQSERAARRSTSGWQKTFDMFGRMFIRIAAFRIFSALSQGIVTGIQDMALASNRANSAMSALSTNALYLKNSVGAALMPVLQSLVPVLNQITDALANVFNTIAALNARIFNHSSTVTIAKRANVDYAATLNKSGNGASNANKKIKELQRTVMGFDELNKLSKETESSTPKSKSGSGSAGMPSYGNMFKTVKVPGWVNKIGQVTDKIANFVKDNVNTLNRLLKASPLVIGAILVFSGANVRLGLGLMAVGAVLMAKQAKEDWDYLHDKTKTSLDKVKRLLAITGAVELAIGAIFAFSGANVGLGIALMAGGIATTAATLNWDSLSKKVEHSLGAFTFTSAVAMLALGSIFAFSGANIPLGVGLLIAGATTMWASATLNWGSMSSQLKQQVGAWTAIVSGALFTLGVILMCAGNFPLGVGMIIAGSIGIVSAATLNWNLLKTKMSGKLGEITAVCSTFLLALGLMLVLTGSMLPLGIGLIIAGGAGLATSATINWNYIKDKMGEALKGVEEKWNEFKSWWKSWGPVKWFREDVAPWFTKEKWKGLAKQAIDAITAPFKNIKWPKIEIPQISWVSGGWKSTGWIYDVLNALHLPTQLPKLQVKWHANGGIFDTPTIAGIGEAGPEAALPLNDEAFSKIAKGIVKNSGSSNDKVDTDRILDRMDKMEHAIENIQVFLYTDDKKIAESANRGNRVLGRTSPTAT